ncbi:hypothetical protein [Desulfosporosinus nitroreducens]|uniref:hypothetical protein n=1 Tax=Desulfosporosinus nitroreducens TaxID=2018668 RepID=UPI00207CFB5A|nr:hypothetical protein [Desulfosporosinus nitroreducens]MCO1599843.1 hypothetical protein [Desulfosporosinus nitroreducens]
MERVTTRELYSQLQDRLMIELGENEILCPECKGLRFVFVERGEKGYIEHCKRCYTGKQYICKRCGKGNKTDHCECEEARQERRDKFDLEESRKSAAAYEKAEKVNYKDYDGYFLLPHSERLQEIEDVRDWIYDKLSNGEDVPEYLWAVEGETHFSIDLQDVISEKCEDGYEDMYSNLSTGSPLITQAQELINQWEKEQGESLYLFTETYKKAVIIEDLINEVRSEIAIL